MSLSNNQIKNINALRQKKYRNDYGLFIVEGEKMVKELLQQNSLQIDSIYIQDAFIDEFDASKHKINIINIKSLEKISGLHTPNKALAIVNIPEYSLEQYDAQDWCLYLDNIQDPGNMGTIFRIADWFGIPWVFCNEGCVDVYNPKVVQASMSALLRVKSLEISFDNIRQKFPDLTVFGADMSGENVLATALPNKGILVIGNEGNGICADISNQINHFIAIPSANTGAESLNAAVATGIICAALQKFR